KLIRNYIYKGPVLEWYLRIKLKFEQNYLPFDAIIPRECTITDLGCGYGFLSYMLSFISSRRKIIGVDYDENKIDVANNCFSKSDKTTFVCADVTNFLIQPSDVFILSDVLHYLPKEAQKNLVHSCLDNLNSNGKVIIREGDRSLSKRHKGTKLTELFSTRILKFNKTSNDLFFLSAKEIFDLASERNMHVGMVDKNKFTSNVMYILSPL
ncbi:MAG TPA: class I SAM-dependent methyltransferase, partial [Cytophagaceae bacterium]